MQTMEQVAQQMSRLQADQGSQGRLLEDLALSRMVGATERDRPLGFTGGTTTPRDYPIEPPLAPRGAVRFDICTPRDAALTPRAVPPRGSPAVPPLNWHKTE